MEYQYIVNPATNRKCRVDSALGKRIINNYRKLQRGGDGETIVKHGKGEIANCGVMSKKGTKKVNLIFVKVNGSNQFKYLKIDNTWHVLLDAYSVYGKERRNCKKSCEDAKGDNGDCMLIEVGHTKHGVDHKEFAFKTIELGDMKNIAAIKLISGYAQGKPQMNNKLSSALEAKYGKNK